jgi:hypothetical protein
LGEKVTTHAKVLCLCLHHVTSFGGEGHNACEPSEVILGNSIRRAEELKMQVLRRTVSPDI